MNVSKSVTLGNFLFRSRFIGILFLLSFICPILNWVFLLSKFTSTENDSVSFLLENEALLRLAIFNELVTAVLIIMLGTSLYVALRNVNRQLALLGIAFKVFEAAIVVGIALN